MDGKWTRSVELGEYICLSVRDRQKDSRQCMDYTTGLGEKRWAL
jgi:hypothetical protein